MLWCCVWTSTAVFILLVACVEYHYIRSSLSSMWKTNWSMWLISNCCVTVGRQHHQFHAQLPIAIVHEEHEATPSFGNFFIGEFYYTCRLWLSQTARRSLAELCWQESPNFLSSFTQGFAQFNYRGPWITHDFFKVLKNIAKGLESLNPKENELGLSVWTSTCSKLICLCFLMAETFRIAINANRADADPIRGSILVWRAFCKSLGSTKFPWRCWKWQTSLRASVCVDINRCRKATWVHVTMPLVAV